MIDLAIVGGTVITMDPARRVLRGGGVAVDGGRIVAVEANPEAIPEAHHRIDAGGMIVLPGLVDSHGHAGHCLTRGLGEGAADDGWNQIRECARARTDHQGGNGAADLPGTRGADSLFNAVRC